MENTMQLSLNGNTFAGMKEDFDAILGRTISNMESKGAEEATITLKLNISLAKEETTPLDADDDKKEIVRPDFKHVISSVMQVKAKKTGALSGDYELVFDKDEDKYVMRKIEDGQLSIFDAVYENEDEVDDSEAVPNDEEDNNNVPANAPFEWLEQFIGEEMSVTEAMGNYTVRTADNRIILSSASEEDSPFHCDAEKLAPHVGHKLICAGYGSEGVCVNIAIECEDCYETLFSMDLYPDEEDEEDMDLYPGGEDEEDYDFDEPDDSDDGGDPEDSEIEEDV